MQCDTRTGLFNFWNFPCRKRLEKGLLQFWLLRALKKFYLTYFQKLKWFCLLVTKDRLLGKVWGKLFSDAVYPGPLLQRSPLIILRHHTEYWDSDSFVSLGIFDNESHNKTLSLLNCASSKSFFSRKQN